MVSSFRRASCYAGLIRSGKKPSKDKRSLVRHTYIYIYTYTHVGQIKYIVTVIFLFNVELGSTFKLVVQLSNHQSARPSYHGWPESGSTTND